MEIRRILNVVQQDVVDHPLLGEREIEIDRRHRGDYHGQCDFLWLVTNLQ